MARNFLGVTENSPIRQSFGVVKEIVLNAFHRTKYIEQNTHETILADDSFHKNATVGD